MADLPSKGRGLTRGESPSLYKATPMDNVDKGETSGGYEYRRRKFTRQRYAFETGFIGLPHVEYLVLKQFYDTHQQDVAFTWPDYMHGINRNVRFDSFAATHVGAGTNRLWTVKIKMSEV